MSLRRVAVLFRKDVRYGARGFIFVLAVVVPLTLSILFSLLFGSFTIDKPKFGIVDEGESQLAAALRETDYLWVQEFLTSEDLMQSLETGGVEVGLVLPAGFDAALQAGDTTEITFFVWGQSLVKNRAIISAAVTEQIVNLSGRETPITVNTLAVGDRAAVSWQQRLLPVVVLMAVMFGGMLIPSTSMIEERQARTLTAVTTTPLTMAEVFISKGALGALVSVFTGLMILTLNGGWGDQPLLLLFALGLSSIFAAAFGVFLGSRVKDVQSLFAVIKSTGILLYAPAIISMFPESLPQWIARLFPTYYIFHPIMEISQRGAGFGDVALDLLILIVLIIAMIALLGRSAQRLQVQPA